MSGRMTAVRQPNSARPPPESLHKIYPVGNGSIRLLIDKRSDPCGRWERIYISITDSVVEKEGSGTSGSAKFDVSLTDHDVRGERWDSIINFCGNFMSSGTKTVQEEGREREWHFYSRGDKFRGCFFLEKDQDSPVWAAAQLLFGFDFGVVHAISVKIRCRGRSLFADIEAPTVQTEYQLQRIVKVFLHIKSKAEDDTEDGEGIAKQLDQLALGGTTNRK